MDKDFKTYYRKWSLAHSLLNILGLVVISMGFQVFIWVGANILSFAYYIYMIPKYAGRTNTIISYANWVTSFRLMIVLALGLTYTGLNDIILFIGFLLIISLDGVDGYLARKFNQSSKVGEALDMETDAFMVFLMSWIHYKSGFEWWILIPGSMRYFSELFIHKLNKVSNADLPKKIRSTIAVIFFISLLAHFILPEQVSEITLSIAAILVSLSFFFSILLKVLNFRSNTNFSKKKHA